MTSALPSFAFICFSQTPLPLSHTFTSQNWHMHRMGGSKPALLAQQSNQHSTRTQTQVKLCRGDGKIPTPNSPIPIYRQFGILDGAATCSEGFVKSFIKVPLACLGSMHGSCSISLQPGELSEKSEQNLWNKWPPHQEYMGELLEGWRALQPSWAVLNKCMKVHLNICNSTTLEIE